MKKFLSPWTDAYSYAAVRFFYTDKFEINIGFHAIYHDLRFSLKKYNTDMSRKTFFTLNGAKKYVDNKLREDGYILIDSEEQLNRYKLLL
jgi:hypothetical protein